SDVKWKAARALCASESATDRANSTDTPAPTSTISTVTGNHIPRAFQLAAIKRRIPFHLSGRNDRRLRVDRAVVGGASLIASRRAPLPARRRSVGRRARARLHRVRGQIFDRPPRRGASSVRTGTRSVLQAV